MIRQLNTHYSMLWHSHTQTTNYKDSVKEMEKAGMKQPYITNILRRSFDAGYKDRVASAFEKLINYPPNDVSGKDRRAGSKSR